MSDEPKVQKSYGAVVSGVKLDVDQAAAQAAFTPDAGARKDFIRPMPPTPLQPGETIAGSTGQMVTDTPSGSGTGAMIPGAGQRS